MPIREVLSQKFYFSNFKANLKNFDYASLNKLFPGDNFVLRTFSTLFFMG